MKPDSDRGVQAKTKFWAVVAGVTLGISTNIPHLGWGTLLLLFIVGVACGILFRDLQKASDAERRYLPFIVGLWILTTLIMTRLVFSLIPVWTS